MNHQIINLQKNQTFLPISQERQYIVQYLNKININNSRILKLIITFCLSFLPNSNVPEADHSPGR